MDWNNIKTELTEHFQNSYWSIIGYQGLMLFRYLPISKHSRSEIRNIPISNKLCNVCFMLPFNFKVIANFRNDKNGQIGEWLAIKQWKTHII